MLVLLGFIGLSYTGLIFTNPIEAHAGTKEQTSIDYERLAKRLHVTSGAYQPYSAMTELRKVVRVMKLLELAREVLLLSDQEFERLGQAGDFSYQSETQEPNPVVAFYYNYESFYATHHHQDSPEELINDALDFYYGRNFTVKNVKAAQYRLKELRRYKQAGMKKALDELLASNKLTIEF